MAVNGKPYLPSFTFVCLTFPTNDDEPRWRERFLFPPPQKSWLVDNCASKITARKLAVFRCSSLFFDTHRNRLVFYRLPHGIIPPLARARDIGRAGPPVLAENLHCLQYRRIAICHIRKPPQFMKCHGAQVSTKIRNCQLENSSQSKDAWPLRNTLRSCGITELSVVIFLTDGIRRARVRHMSGIRSRPFPDVRSGA